MKSATGKKMRKARVIENDRGGGYKCHYRKGYYRSHSLRRYLSNGLRRMTKKYAET